MTLFICGFWNQYLITSRENPQQYFDKALTIDTNQITIDKTIYEIETLQKLKIIINDYDGQMSATGRGAKIILNGTDNQLSFIHLNENICLPFYIISEIQKEEFKTLFESWYKNKIKFYEGNIGGKTYLLLTLNFQQIQEFKRNYDLT